jgi:nucleotide-binding universal stress UspA family protein
VVQTLAPLPTPLEANTYVHERAYSVICEADEHERHRLANAVAKSEAALRGAGLIVSSKLIEGDPRETIVSEAESFKAHTIFVGARGLGRVERLLLGSVSNYVVTHAPCTVEVVRP